MSEHARSIAAKRAANLTIDAELLAEARHYDINLSRAAEAGIARAVADAKADRWKKENNEALQSSNVFVDANGLPLAQFRQF